MSEYRLSPAALADLEAIFDYSAEHWSLAQAVRYTGLIRGTCERLAEAPTTARDASAIRPGYRYASAGSHVVYFRIEDEGIAVIRILHSRMDPARHL